MGWDADARLREFDKELRVIILTAYPSHESATDALNLDVSAYMQKPFRGGEMRETIARVARRHGIIVRREDEFHVTVGRRIRNLREQGQLSSEQLSRRTKLSITLLAQIERAESSPSLASLYKIASALDVRVADLIGNF